MMKKNIRPYLDHHPKIDATCYIDEMSVVIGDVTLAENVSVWPFAVIRGDVKIDQGIASTNNLQMKGVSAAALMEGTANIHRETQDIKVVVVPELNAGTASLVATAINPAIGIGTFLAQLILRRPVIEAATQEFHITGSWADPQIERVKRVKAPSAVTPEVNKP